MCYWRRLSKRSVSEFDYEYTTNSSGGSNSSLVEQQPIISDSLNLFKALQVRHESENSRSGRSRGELREVYAQDDEAALVCYRHTEVSIFLMTILSLLALVITIAVTCCLRVRKLMRSQYEHNRLASTAPLSPSLLSISDAISSAGSLLSSTSVGLGSKAPRLWPQQHQPIKPQPPSKPLYLQRQRPKGSTTVSTFHPRVAYLYLLHLAG